MCGDTEDNGWADVYQVSVVFPLFCPTPASVLIKKIRHKYEYESSHVRISNSTSCHTAEIGKAVHVLRRPQRS